MGKGPVLDLDPSVMDPAHFLPTLIFCTSKTPFIEYPGTEQSEKNSLVLFKIRHAVYEIICAIGFSCRTINILLLIGIVLIISVWLCQSWGKCFFKRTLKICDYMQLVYTKQRLTPCD